MIGLFITPPPPPRPNAVDTKANTETVSRLIAATDNTFLQVFDIFPILPTFYFYKILGIQQSP
ncbi:MAG: hypothetical protein QXN96_03930, partial [Candidatus Bathyarchaeia archaeon]